VYVHAYEYVHVDGTDQRNRITDLPDVYVHAYLRRSCGPGSLKWCVAATHRGQISSGYRGLEMLVAIAAASSYQWRLIPFVHVTVHVRVHVHVFYCPL
jgi:hypothetical protein